MPSIMTLQGYSMPPVSGWLREAAPTQPTQPAPRRGLAWLAVGAIGIIAGIAAWRLAQRKVPALRGSSSSSSREMLSVIARESRSPEEYARRADAWNSAEREPVSQTTLVRAYVKHDPRLGTRVSSKVRQLLREAEEARLESRERMWSKMSKGLRSVNGYRVWYGTSGMTPDGDRTFAVDDGRTVSTVEAATKLMRSYKRRGFWTWVEDEQGNFVPVPGAKNEKIRKSYPKR